MSSTSSSRSSCRHRRAAARAGAACCSRAASNTAEEDPDRTNSYRSKTVEHDVQDASAAASSRCRTSTCPSHEGEFVALIGHSGCGKSTLLNLVAGLLAPDDGVLLCAGREIAGPGPERGVVFQNHSLLPWLTCFENVHLAVERVFGGVESKAQLKARTHEALELVQLAHAAHQAAERNFGRNEAARRHRARAVDGAQGAAARRAVRRARRADARASAGRVDARSSRRRAARC